MPVDTHPFARAVERLLDVSILVLVTVSFAALAATGKLDPLSTLAVTIAIAARAVFFLRDVSRQLSVRTTTRLTVLYAFIYAIDYFAISQSFITATVHLVLFVLVVKLFSVHRDRDRVYLAIIAFLMLLAAAILTIDAFYLGAFALFSLVAIVAFIVMEIRRSMNATATVSPAPGTRLWKLVSITAMTLIVAILALTPFLFFALPRVSAGRLSQFAQQNSFTTGFGDEVTLGQIGEIQQSDSVVMRAQFDHEPPATLKWHGTTLSHFDGRRWFNRRNDERILYFRGSLDNTITFNHPEARRILDGLGTADLHLSERMQRGTSRYISYRVNLEPIGANLFFYPTKLITIRGGASRDYLLSSNSVLTYRDPSASVVRSYAGLSLVETAQEPRDAGNDQRHLFSQYLELPQMDSRVATLAQTVSVSAATPFAKAEAIETYLRTQFGYTLEMQAAEDPIPFFLFERKKGHCEYFASAMAVMLRSVGIPSRIVNGFRNGEKSDVTGSYLIRARDAHSWVEAYIPGAGWVEFDPTPSGAPAPKTLWSRVNLYIDAAREFWGDWVINYDFAHQNLLAENTTNTARFSFRSLRKFLDNKYWAIITRIEEWITRSKSATFIPTSLGLALAVVAVGVTAFIVWFRRRLRYARAVTPEHLASLWLERLLKRTSRKGLRKSASQTASAWAQSVPDSQLRASLSSFVREYESARFGASKQSCDKLPNLYEEVEELLK